MEQHNGFMRNVCESSKHTFLIQNLRIFSRLKTMPKTNLCSIRQIYHYRI
nr:MAG TPA_asm: hypothetical protein [Caudoviricetes sp.]